MWQIVLFNIHLLFFFFIHCWLFPFRGRHRKLSFSISSSRSLLIWLGGWFLEQMLLFLCSCFVFFSVLCICPLNSVLVTFREVTLLIILLTLQVPVMLPNSYFANVTAQDFAVQFAFSVDLPHTHKNLFFYRSWVSCLGKTMTSCYINGFTPI